MEGNGEVRPPPLPPVPRRVPTPASRRASSVLPPSEVLRGARGPSFPRHRPRSVDANPNRRTFAGLTRRRRNLGEPPRPAPTRDDWLASHPDPRLFRLRPGRRSDPAHVESAVDLVRLDVGGGSPAAHTFLFAVLLTVPLLCTCGSKDPFSWTAGDHCRPFSASPQHNSLKRAPTTQTLRVSRKKLASVQTRTTQDSCPRVPRLDPFCRRLI